VTVVFDIKKIEGEDEHREKNREVEKLRRKERGNRERREKSRNGGDREKN
jgi:hypothetical protein